MNLLVIDFETYYDTDYSLSKMTTDAYVLDPRFKVHGCGVWFPQEEPVPRWLTNQELVDFFAHVDWSDTAVLAHNTAFDGFILAHHYGHTPKVWLDTLSMARALIGVQVGGSLSKVAKFYDLGSKGNELVLTRGIRDLSPELEHKLGLYCCNDVELCMGAYRKMSPEFNNDELRLIDLTLRMFIDPCIELNAELLREYVDSEQARKEDLLKQAGATKEALMSGESFAQLLFMYGVDAPTKVSPRTNKRTYAFAKTDPGMRALLESDDDAIRWLAEARLGVKSTINETRGLRLLEVAERGNQWPVLLNYYGAHTGRWSGGNKQNAQNLPRGGTLRQAVVAPDGQRIVVVDSAQIEARVLAWVAGQDDLVQVFRDKGDPYSRQATAVYSRPIVKGVDKDERQVGKVLVLACGYGMGAEKFRATLKAQGGVTFTQEQADRAVSVYRTTNPAIVKFWNTMDANLRRIASGVTANFGFWAIGPQGIQLPNGLWIKYPNLHSSLDGMVYDTARGEVHVYGGRAVENFVQALARIVVAEQMLRIEREVLRPMGGRIWLMSHDEVCMLSPANKAPAVLARSLEIMHQPPVWANLLPVAAEGGIGFNYGEAKP